MKYLPIFFSIVIVIVLRMGISYGYRSYQLAQNQKMQAIQLVRNRQEFSQFSKEHVKLLNLGDIESSSSSGVTKNKADWDSYYASEINQANDIQTETQTLTANNSDLQNYSKNLVTTAQGMTAWFQAELGGSDMNFKVRSDTSSIQFDKNKILLSQGQLADLQSSGLSYFYEEADIKQSENTLQTDQQQLISDQVTEKQSRAAVDIASKAVSDQLYIIKAIKSSICLKYNGEDC